MVPKIIHFVWVGDQPKPELVQNCIASWRKFCPDYEIMEWGNERLTEIENQYVQEAAAAKKWAFVSDYIRLFALKRFGGFYFDSDLEITGDLETFRKFNFLTGFERGQGRRARPITALMGASKGNRIVCDLLSEYDGLKFIKDGDMDLTPNTDRITSFFRKNFGLKRRYNGETKVFLDKNSVVFPYFYFCTPKPGERNYSIHHFNGSWVEPGKRKYILKVGNWRLLKFSFALASNSKVQLYDGEKMIVKIAFKFGKRRALVLVKK
ncbi:MAG: glycosyltransferase [Emcibacteraceae bacterium]|jgi:hypothetical protein|tara:strand:- start:493 stop:1287 length:795 start_codon:yes stop_codon:yes gene_type:complete